MVGCSSLNEMTEGFPPTDPREGLVLQWHDEFDGNQLDLTQWAYREDIRHRSIQQRENVEVADGVLRLNFRKLPEPIHGKWASGAGVVSRRRFHYGYFEVRARLGTGQDTDGDGETDEGWHHAFWAMAAKIGGNTVSDVNPASRRTEIDCFENASDHQNKAEFGLDRFTQHVIIWNPDGQEEGRRPEPPEDIVAPPEFDPQAWYTYGFRWEKDTVTFYVDGLITKIADYPSPPYTHDQLNLWITAISAEWCGEDAEDSRAEYDYVRYYGFSQGD